jgi:hypothetical protein
MPFFAIITQKNEIKANQRGRQRVYICNSVDNVDKSRLTQVNGWKNTREDDERLG